MATLQTEGWYLSTRMKPRGLVSPSMPKFPEVFAVGVCVAIPPVGKTAVPVGFPKTGFMIESMVAATARNIQRLVNGQEPDAQGAGA